MGTNAAISAELQHLWSSSHALSSTNPSTAAHLMSQFYSLADKTGTAISPADRRTACGACGTFRVPGITGSYRTKSNRPKIRQKPSAKEGEGEKAATEQTVSQMVYTCKVCGTETTEDIPSRPKVKRKRPQVRAVVEDVKMADEPGTVGAEWAKAKEAAELPKPAPAKSRKKNKKGASLSALLAKEKEKKSAASPAGGFGLDFMDFMKM